MEEINLEAVRATLERVDPVLEALSILLKEVTNDAVQSLVAVLRLAGVSPTDLPGEFVLQAMLVESERVFQKISRESWISIYDSYQQVKTIIDENPELRDISNSAAPKSTDSLLNGDF